MLTLKANISYLQKMRDVIIAFAVVAGVMVLGAFSIEILEIFAGSFIKRFDPNNYFATSSFNFFFSLLLTLAVMKGFSRKGFRYWGFNLRNRKFSLKVFLIFCVIYTPVIYYTMVIDGAQKAVASGQTIDTIGIIGSLSNHLFINGIYQEALFRGFIMVFLSRSWPGVWRIGKMEIPHTAFWSTLIFVLAHARFGQDPMFYTWQVVWTLVLGLYYSIMFHKTKSLLNPILSHSYSNAIYVTLLLVQASLKTG